MTRAFSQIEGYQAAYELTYTLEPTAGGSCLTVSRSGRKECRVSRHVALCPDEAEHLLQYLCENAVQPELWLDVLADLCPAEREPASAATC